MTNITDKNGKTLKNNDLVHNDYGFDLIVKFDKKNNEFYGKLVCDKTHSCANIPYNLNTNEITFIKHLK